MRPPQVNKQYRQEIVHIPDAQQPVWQRPTTLVAVAVGGVSVTAVALVLFGGNGDGIYQPEANRELDKAAIVAGAQQASEGQIFNSLEQLEAFRVQLIAQEAERYARAAEKQVQDVEASCYLQAVSCVYDQFGQDAIAQIEQAKASQDWQTMILAEARVQAVELARQGVIAPEPETNLTQLAIQNLVDAHQKIRAASAEAKAAELRAGEEL